MHHTQLVTIHQYCGIHYPSNSIGKLKWKYWFLNWYQVIRPALCSRLKEGRLENFFDCSSYKQDFLLSYLYVGTLLIIKCAFCVPRSIGLLFLGTLCVFCKEVMWRMDWESSLFFDQKKVKPLMMAPVGSNNWFGFWEYIHARCNTQFNHFDLKWVGKPARRPSGFWCLLSPFFNLTCQFDPLISLDFLCNL